MNRLRLEAHTEGGVAHVRLAGELDLASAPEAEEKIRQLEAAMPSMLLLDLRELDFLDSTGLRLVLDADARARRDGRRLVVVKGPERVHRVFRIALLDRRLDFVDEPSDRGADGGQGD